MKKNHFRFFAVLATAVFGLLSGCATASGRWVTKVPSAVAPAANTLIVLNNRTDLYLEVRVNGSPVTIKTPSGVEEIAYIPPRGSVSKGFSSFIRYYQVVITVVGKCPPRANSACKDGLMATRQYPVNADGTYRQTYSWDVDPYELR